MKKTIPLTQDESAAKKERVIKQRGMVTDEDVRNSEVLKRQIERAKRRLKEIRFPNE